MGADPVFVAVRARDVKPYHYALWSSVCGGAPFANTICHVQWSEDGLHLWFGLDSHNTYKTEPDAMLELIDLADDPSAAFSRERHRDWTLPPPGMEFHPLTGDPVFRDPRRRALAEATTDEIRAELARREVPDGQ